ncbi:unnamed protein product, partial [Cyprideis torosa]
MDADLQDRPEEIPEFYDMIVNGGYDLVSGWKQKRKDNKLTKNLPSLLFNGVARKISGVPLHDFNCGLKAYKKEVVKSFDLYGDMHRYLPVLAKLNGFHKITEKKIQHDKRKYGRSKFGSDRFIKGFLDLTTLWFIKNKAQEWLNDSFDTETQAQVQQILQNEKELLECFGADLEFGTGGMRGIMGVGTNRINKYTIGKITQGLANYLNQVCGGEEIAVAVAYDVRHNSKAFAQLIADILSANGIKVYIFDDFRPTPLLSYAVRFLGCKAGIVLTASHNPPEYNGYKVYWEDGGQIVPPQDHEIVAAVNEVNFDQVRYDRVADDVIEISDELEREYMAEAQKVSLFDAPDRTNIKVVFTPIHGTSVHLLPRTLYASGFTDIVLVNSQLQPSGDFPTVVSPNPEEPEALAEAITLAKETQADLLIGTDPDADRLGVGVRKDDGEYYLLNGNETNTIMTYFLLKELKRREELSSSHFIGSTVVSSDIFMALAKHFNINCKLGLTGFKWIAKMITDAEPHEIFVCGGEESYGFMVGDFVRDKDSISSALLFCEVASILKSEGKNVLQYLDEIYEQLGYYSEKLLSFKKEGVAGKKEIADLMTRLRENPPESIAGEPVLWVEDYKDHPTKKNMETGKVEAMDIASSNVLIFRTRSDYRICARPSGTEPKIKFYLGASEK